MRLLSWHKPTCAFVVVVLIATGYVVSQTAVAKDKSSLSPSRAKNREVAKNAGRPSLNQIAKATPRHEIPSLDLSTGDVVKSSVTKIPSKQVRRISRKIDELVDAKLTAAGIEPAPLASDEVFLRRAYLDIIGRIPTLEETNAFLDSKEKQKRTQLIDELLDSYGYVSRQFNFWADLLRVKTDLRNVGGQPYVDFIKDSLSENKPYDDFVREMLTASGPNFQRGNGAVGYYMRDLNMQEDNMSNTVRIFLGTRLECAQCHDHPFDVWTQRDYFEMVAYTGGISFRSQPIDSEHRMDLMRLRNDKTLGQEERGAIRKMIEPMTYGVSGEGNGLARLPEDYDAGDGEPHEIVTAKTMFEKEPLVDVEVPAPNSSKKKKKRVNAKYPQRIYNAPEVGSREAYAHWMTAPENPRFSTVIVNRLWKQVMGLGIVEPLDTFSDDTVAANRPLLDYLAETMIDLDFDMKQLLRAIYNSDTYQRVADAGEVTNPKTHCFNGPLVRRMKAEQIWDSLLGLATTDIDKRQRGGSGKGMRYLPGLDIYDGYEELRELDVDQIRTLSEAYMKRREGGRVGKDAMAKAMTEVFGDAYKMEKKSKSKNGKYSSEITGAQVGMEMAQLNKKWEAAKADRDHRGMQRISKERQELVAYVRQIKRKGDFLRASELPSPARPGHFLREFGQSDRDQIDNANQEPAVTQSLSLMNGLVERTISRYQQSTLMKSLQAADAPKDQVRVAYLSMLNRQPRLEESELWTSAIEDDGRVGISDMIWTLTNSVEFLFVK